MTNLILSFYNILFFPKRSLFSVSQNVSPNMKLWGVVAEVNAKDLVISLPGGLRGFVRAEEVLDIIPDDELKVPVLICNVFNDVGSKLLGC